MSEYVCLDLRLLSIFVVCACVCVCVPDVAWRCPEHSKLCDCLTLSGLPTAFYGLLSCHHHHITIRIVETGTPGVGWKITAPWSSGSHRLALPVHAFVTNFRSGSQGPWRVRGTCTEDNSETAHDEETKLKVYERLDLGRSHYF